MESGGSSPGILLLISSSVTVPAVAPAEVRLFSRAGRLAGLDRSLDQSPAVGYRYVRVQHRYKHAEYVSIKLFYIYFYTAFLDRNQKSGIRGRVRSPGETSIVSYYYLYKVPVPTASGCTPTAPPIRCTGIASASSFPEPRDSFPMAGNLASHCTSVPRQWSTLPKLTHLHMRVWPDNHRNRWSVPYVCRFPPLIGLFVYRTVTRAIYLSTAQSLC